MIIDVSQVKDARQETIGSDELPGDFLAAVFCVRFPLPAPTDFLPVPVSDMDLWIRSPVPLRIPTKFPAWHQVIRIRIVTLPFLIRILSPVPALFHGSSIQVIFHSVSCSSLKRRSGRIQCPCEDQIRQPDKVGYGQIPPDT